MPIIVSPETTGICFILCLLKSISALSKSSDRVNPIIFLVIIVETGVRCFMIFNLNSKVKLIQKEKLFYDIYHLLATIQILVFKYIQCVKIALINIL
ncbi:hypothetical protein GCM10023311_07130 [Flaviramulus aquimarinus]|uniref:Uncharacterized protein n=1 Tax=Flaviramulus aquimarinus TaxID=1170456 RepID=A0ABP9EU02_9FLAO